MPKGISDFCNLSVHWISSGLKRERYPAKIKSSRVTCVTCLLANFAARAEAIRLPTSGSPAHTRSYPNGATCLRLLLSP